VLGDNQEVISKADPVRLGRQTPGGSLTALQGSYHLTNVQLDVGVTRRIGAKTFSGGRIVLGQEVVLCPHELLTAEGRLGAQEVQRRQ